MDGDVVVIYNENEHVIKVVDYRLLSKDNFNEENGDEVLITTDDFHTVNHVIAIVERFDKAAKTVDLRK